MDNIFIVAKQEGRGGAVTTVSIRIPDLSHSVFKQRQTRKLGGYFSKTF